MFCPVILIVLFWRVRGHFGAKAIFNQLKTTAVLLQDAAVSEMTVCVTFGAPRFGPKYRHIGARSGCATFSTISATAVREMTVCVTFGALQFSFRVATWRHPTVDHIGNVSHGSGFRQLRC